MYSRERWTCSFCEHLFTAQRMVMRLASTFSGPPTTSFKCSMALSILRCTVWKKRDGLFPNGRRPLIAIGNSSITGLRKRAENNLWSKRRTGSRCKKPWPASCGPRVRRVEMRWWQIMKQDADLERELQSDIDLEEEEQRERGLPPRHPRHAALRAFG